MIDCPGYDLAFLKNSLSILPTAAASMKKEAPYSYDRAYGLQFAIIATTAVVVILLKK